MPEGLAAYQHSHRSEQQEQALLLTLCDVVKRVVAHLALQTDHVMDKDDMEQIGLMALLETIRRYPTLDETELRHLVPARIRGAILDELRRLDWRSRQQRQRAHQLRDTQRELMKQLGRAATESELSEALSITLPEVRARLLDAEAEHQDSLETLQEERASIPGLNVDGLPIERERLREALINVLSTFKERDQAVISFYYAHEMSFKEIALVFDLTEARVCQIHKKVLAALSRRLADWQLA